MTNLPSNDASPLVIIAAGGTGGHMFPAQAFATEMVKRGWRVGLVTDDRGMKYVENFPAEWIEQVKAATIGSKRPDKLIVSALKIKAGIGAAKKHMKRVKPALVAGFGGYPSFPSLSAAKALHVPIIIHEQNAVLGRVNRLFAKHAVTVASGFGRLDRIPKEAESHRIEVGNPVRAPILAIRDLPYPAVTADTKINLLVTGGSQGAKMFGEVVPAAIEQLPESLRSHLHMVQQVREDQIPNVQAIYDAAGVTCELAPFFNDMDQRLAVTHLVIARSGAGTVTELCVAGRPAILIPLGIAMDDHQRANAESLEAGGGAEVILEKEFTKSALAHVLEELLGPGGDLELRAAAAKALGPLTAAEELADIAIKAANL
ncbi:undecaprenyldiphospho-muramoylpentapeptide beta-N-acetylglucosaminyltransferase [Hirschia baltica]|uniref:UDP-N-acetylglucosamine--N-acetylmuramyl-(pentapeptide) pyrophosphoryl-undecaprenol N-acetylglucosamine transferase n=1 Tax=Hirschia baltica (strain ATCC 49814 / DSM 5838 / IFAM 1418) TaxID=582402 RepID=C6XMF2_HIRBI|nr:undecaprenyldiphospho-muramoylpentapeptide beta-N-acetylglucosaminyltransferase [Hirschia baltica]ACT58095.1 Undecaprenyldiphospho-muramoylpentapeptide beta-N-acetylglucosaminyltransferase [Hirschia baltica ATCC 49814]